MSSGADKLLLGLVRIHVLAAAESGPVWGNKILTELRQQDQTLSPGTMYPLLRGLVRDGLLKGRTTARDRRRQCFQITPEGLRTLALARARLRHLLDDAEKPGTPEAPPVPLSETTRPPLPESANPPVHLL